MTNRQGCILLILSVLVSCMICFAGDLAFNPTTSVQPRILEPTSIPAPTKPPWSETAAIMACRDYVRLNLAYPSTAKFSLWGTESKEYTGGYFTVRGTVKAKNAFGLELDFNYFCNVRYSNGSYVLEDLEIF